MSAATQNALKIRARQHEAEPADLELDALDLEAAGPFESVLIDARQSFQATVWSDVTDVAASLGDFSLFVDLYARDGTTLIESVELYSAQSANGNNQVKTTFGQGVDATVVGTATAGSDIQSLKMAFLFKFRVVNDTPADGESALSIRVQFGD